MSASTDSVAAVLGEAAVSACWRQWRVLTSAHAQQGETTLSIVDPEALLLLSLVVRSRERRLQDLVAWWAAKGSTLLSVQRTRTLLAAFPKSVTSDLAWFASVCRDAGDRRWLAVAAQYADNVSDIAVRPGKGSDTLELVPPATLLLRLRAGFGVGVKADLLAFLVGSAAAVSTREAWASVETIAAAITYSSASVRRAAAEMTLARFKARFRQQVLVRGDLLASLQGQQIEALWFRRDYTLGRGFQGHGVQLVVSLSHAAMSSTAPAGVFAANRGPARLEVFNGTLTLPPALAIQPPLAWQAPQAVRIPCTPPFAFGGGDLCIEIEGTPLAPGPLLWSVDYVQEANGSSVRSYGAPCGVAATRSQATALAWSRYASPGADMTVTTIGRPGTPGFLLLASSPASVPLDAIGATGCSLYVQPQVFLPLAYGAATSGLDTALLTAIALPASPTLLGAQMYLQGANLETGGAQSNPAGVTTTNGLEVMLGAVMPAAALSTVMSAEVAAGEPLPTTGRVFVGRGPVLRFEAR